MKALAFVRKFPVLVYFVLTLLISWGSLLLVMGVGGILGTTTVPTERMPLLYVGMLLGPTIAGVVMTGFTQGRSGFRELFSKLRHWRVGIEWYLVAILTAPGLVAVVLLFMSQFSSGYVPGILTSGDKFSILVSGLAAGIMVGIFEELGWTGFVVPRLRQNYGILATGLIVGFVWGLWHMPLFVASARASQEIAPLITLAVMLFTFLPAFRVLMVWVYDRTNSLFVAMVMHMSQTATTRIYAIPEGGAITVVSNLFYCALLCLFTAVIFKISRRHSAGEQQSI